MLVSTHLEEDLQFCAGGKGQIFAHLLMTFSLNVKFIPDLVGSCLGDSGGPIMAFGTVGNKEKFVQYGVVSAGPECATFEGISAIYVRVTAYLTWIMDNIY